MYLRVPKSLAGGLRGQNYFPNNTMMLFAIFTVDICTAGAKAMLSEPAGALA